MLLKIVHHTKLLKTYYYVTEKIIAGFILKLFRLTQPFPRSIINATSNQLGIHFCALT